MRGLCPNTRVSEYLQITGEEDVRFNLGVLGHKTQDRRLKDGRRGHGVLWTTSSFPDSENSLRKPWSRPRRQPSYQRLIITSTEDPKNKQRKFGGTYVLS